MSAPLRILAVEDNDANVALLRALFRRAEDERLRTAELVVATSIAEARHALADGVHQLVLLDVRLPDGSGLELMPMIAELHPRPAVVVLSANALPADELAARDAGADAFMPKPYQPTALLELLSLLVGSGPR